MCVSHLIIFIVDVKNLSSTLDLILSYLHIITMYDFYIFQIQNPMINTILLPYNTCILSQNRPDGRRFTAKEYMPNFKVI
jgi:hypothetical protein